MINNGWPLDSSFLKVAFQPFHHDFDNVHINNQNDTINLK